MINFHRTQTRNRTRKNENVELELELELVKQAELEVELELDIKIDRDCSPVANHLITFLIGNVRYDVACAFCSRFIFVEPL